jgi:hypothetical protein
MADLDGRLGGRRVYPTEVTWNRCLCDIANWLETMGRTMADFGLPEPADDSTEVARKCLRWARRSCQDYVDAHLPLLTPDEQRPIYEEVVEAVRLRQFLLMYVDGRSERGKTPDESHHHGRESSGRHCPVLCHDRSGRTQPRGRNHGTRHLQDPRHRERGDTTVQCHSSE